MLCSIPKDPHFLRAMNPRIVSDIPSRKTTTNVIVNLELGFECLWLAGTKKDAYIFSTILDKFKIKM